MSDSLGNFIEQHTQEVAETNYELGRSDMAAENAMLKKKLEIAMRGPDEYGDEKNWECSYFGISHEHDQDCGQDLWHEKNGYELARRTRAEIEEVK